MNRCISIKKNCFHSFTILIHYIHYSSKCVVLFLGNIPLNLEIRECCDEGKPIVVLKPDSSIAKSYDALAATVLNKLGKNE